MKRVIALVGALALTTTLGAVGAITTAASAAPTAAPSTAKATPRAPEAGVCGAGSMSLQKTVRVPYDRFQESRGVTYVKHCQGLRIIDDALATDVECTSSNEEILKLHKDDPSYVEFLGVGFGKVQVKCKDVGSPTKQTYTRNIFVGAKWAAGEPANCAQSPNLQATQWIPWDFFTEGQGPLYLKRCQLMRISEASEELECTTPNLDESVLSLHDLQLEHQDWRAVGGGSVKLMCTEAGSGEEFERTIITIQRGPTTP